MKKILLAIILFLFLTIPIPALTGAAPVKNPVILTDMAGRQVTVPQPVNRIITTFKPASLCLLSLGLWDRWTGLDTPSAKDPLQRAVFPGVSSLAGVGSKSMGINLETLAALKPDLVVLYSQKDGLALAKRLETLRIPAVVIVPETFDSIKASLAVMAKAAGVPERTGKVADLMDQVLDRVSRRLETLPSGKRKTGYFSSPLNLFSTATGQMLQHEILDAAGIDNVAGNLTGYFRDISGEQLIRWRPDIMVVSPRIRPSAVRELNREPYGEIPAVKNRQIFRCPSTLAPWDFPSPLSVLASLWLAPKVYPDRFSGLDFTKEADRFHKALFGQTLTGMGGRLNDRVDLAP